MALNLLFDQGGIAPAGAGTARPRGLSLLGACLLPAPCASFPAHACLCLALCVTRWPTLALPQSHVCAPLHHRSADDPRGILVWNQTLHTQPLPVALFANGHVAFVQRTPERCVCVCVVWVGGWGVCVCGGGGGGVCACVRVCVCGGGGALWGQRRGAGLGRRQAGGCLRGVPTRLCSPHPLPTLSLPPSASHARVACAHHPSAAGAASPPL